MHQLLCIAPRAACGGCAIARPLRRVYRLSYSSKKAADTIATGVIVPRSPLFVNRLFSLFPFRQNNTYRNHFPAFGIFFAVKPLSNFSFPRLRQNAQWQKVAAPLPEGLFSHFFPRFLLRHFPSQFDIILSSINYYNELFTLSTDFSTGNKLCYINGFPRFSQKNPPTAKVYSPSFSPIILST